MQGDVCAYTVTLAGQPGSVTVHAQDTDGPEGSSKLTRDSLEITLSAGPMTGLTFEETQQLHCGMHDCISALKLLAVDSFGNTADCAAFEVLTVIHSTQNPRPPGPSFIGILRFGHKYPRSASAACAADARTVKRRNSPRLSFAARDR